MVCKDSEWSSKDIYVKVFTRPWRVLHVLFGSISVQLRIEHDLQIVLSVHFMTAQQKCLPDWHPYVFQCVCSGQSRQVSMLCSVPP